MTEPIRLSENPKDEEPKGPLQASYEIFKKNKAAVFGFWTVVGFIFLAITAGLWTDAGVLDHPRGYRARHTLNPVGWKQVDSFADPGQCARDNIDQGEAWCAVVDREIASRFPQHCVAGVPDLSQRQWCYLLGGDGSGKDWLTQTIYGAQISLAVAFVGSMVSLIVGVFYGVISGYYGGSIDSFMMRFVDFLFGIPGLVIIILMQVFFRGISREYEDSGGLIGLIIGVNKDMGGLLFMFIAIGMLGWIGMARLARGQVLAQREQEFVEAARAVGASDRRIIFVHLLPNVIGPLLVVMTLSVPGFIFLEAFLSFIGLGVQPGVPSWGEMISRLQQQGGLGSNQHLVIVPSVALILLTLAFNFLGDGLRDALDPRLRGK
jgi:ABC-type dipeptide/oligopeptide/nickel transport system permease subunit